MALDPADNLCRNLYARISSMRQFSVRKSEVKCAPRSVDNTRGIPLLRFPHSATLSKYVNHCLFSAWPAPTTDKYCSKDCQMQHWKTHRVHCKGPIIRTSWLPAWAKEGRTPTFIDSEDGAPITQMSFGLPLAYLWGNLPAMDCLNLSNNERTSATTRNLKICFAGN